jgi:hypothetical protein
MVYFFTRLYKAAQTTHSTQQHKVIFFFFSDLGKAVDCNMTVVRWLMLLNVDVQNCRSLCTRQIMCGQFFNSTSMRSLWEIVLGNFPWNYLLNGSLYTGTYKMVGSRKYHSFLTANVQLQVCILSLLPADFLICQNYEFLWKPLNCINP